MVVFGVFSPDALASRITDADAKVVITADGGYRRGAPSALNLSLALRQAIWRKTDPGWAVHGLPDVLYADHGSDFTSDHLAQVTADLHIELIHSAVARRAVAGATTDGCTVHSDRGPQFRSRKYLAALRHHHLVGSMGQVGSAGDNAAMESFFGLLQNNVLDRQRWATRQQLRIAIISWIERTYHRRRRQSRLGRLTPIEYETIITTNQAQAA